MSAHRLRTLARIFEVPDFPNGNQVEAEPALRKFHAKAIELLAAGQAAVCQGVEATAARDTDLPWDGRPRSGKREVGRGKEGVAAGR